MLRRERGPHRLEDAAIVGLPEAQVLLLGVEGGARRLDGIEDALAALAEACLHEGEDGLGDGFEGAGDRLRVLLEVVAEPVARELARERERAEHRGHRGAVRALVHHAADDRLEVGGPAGGLHREGADPLPVLGRAHPVARAGAVAVGRDLVRFHAAPVLDGVAARRRDLEEVGVVALVEAQGGLGERGRVAVHVGEVAPEGIGRTIGRLAPDRGLDALELGHTVSRYPSARARAPSGVVARKRWPAGAAASARP